MRTWHFIVFFSIVLVIYGAGNSYVFIRGYRALPEINAVRRAYSALFLFFALSFIIGEVTEKTGITCGNRLLVLTGSLWLAFLLYAIIFTFLVDMVRLADLVYPFLPSARWMAERMVPLKVMTVVAFTSFLVVTAGALSASRPVVRIIDLYIDKHKAGEPCINVVMVSDLHLGNIVGKKKLEKLVQTINSLEPDVVLLPGDFFDENLKMVVQDDMGDVIESIRTNYGVFAVTGNHEYIGGVDEAVEYMRKHKILVLRDEAVAVDGVLIAGREDISMNRFTDRKRQDMSYVLKGHNLDLPVILMDHQPFNIDDSVNWNIDLHLSGHTHNGQLWPLNYITDMIYDISFGYGTVENTQVYVSCGYGTWGPPVRTSGRPELVVFQIRFRQQGH